MKQKFFFLVAFFLIYYSHHLFAQSPLVASHVILENNGTYGKLEFGIELANLPPGLNPYDEEDIEVMIQLKDPYGNWHQAWGFYYKDFVFDPNPPLCDRLGDPVNHDELFTGNTQPGNETRDMIQLEFLDEVSTQYPWRARFAPRIPGQWEYRVNFAADGIDYGSTNWVPFTINRTNNPGFITVHPLQEGEQKRIGFIRETGQSFFPTGGNLNFYHEPYCRSIWDDLYVGSVNQLGMYRGNYARLLMSSDGWRTAENNGFIFNLEGSVDPLDPSNPANAQLGNYDRRQNMAFLLDKLIEQGYGKNVNFQLCPLTYDEFKPGQWEHSPYYSISPALANNGFLFYSDATAKKFFKRKLRYMASRWGYATNLFAWELVGEIDLTLNSINNCDIKTDIRNWMDEMSIYLKDWDPNHLITFSRGNDSHNDFGSESCSIQLGSTTPWLTQLSQLAKIDFTQNHTYATVNCYSGMHWDRNRVSNLKIASKKPSFAGEFGENTPNYSMDGANFDLASNYESYYGRNEFHNNIWSSSFSGADGTATLWWWWIFDNPNYPLAYHSGQVRHFEPLRKLIDQIDFTDGNLKSISNRGLASEAILAPLGLTSAECTTLSSMPYTDQSYQQFKDPSDPGTEGGIVTAPLYSQETADNKMLAFGLKTDWNIYGWFQKRDNWWHNLPHRPTTHPIFSFCNWGATQAACNASTIQENQLGAEFKDVCEGEYIIDYYSTYPHRSTVQGALRDNSNGGEIPALKRRFFTTDRALNIKLPRFSPLDNTALNPLTTSIYAPDYGYKISKIEAENYQSTYIGQYVPWEDVDLAGDIETFYRFPGASKTFFKGLNDGLMHQHYYDPGTNQTIHAMMNNTQGPGEEIGGSMAAEHAQEKTVFYRGTNAELKQYYFVTGTGWVYGMIGSPLTPVDDINLNSEMAATDDQVFYKGAFDNKINLYHFNGTQWLHNPLNNGITGEKLIRGDIKIPIGSYANTDLVFFVNEHDEICLYSRNTGNGGTWTYRVLNTNFPLTPADRPAGNICPVYMSLSGLPGDNYLYCFYIAADGDVHYLVNYSIQAPNQPYPVNSVWEHFTLNVASQQHEKANLSSELYMDVDPDRKVMYYWGNDNYMHRYYWDYQQWSHSTIVPCGNHNFPASANGIYARDFRLTPNNFIYKGTDLRMRTVWNAKNCDKCTPTYPYKKTNNPEMPGAMDQKEQDAFNKKIEYATEEIYVTAYPNPCTDKLNFICDHRTGGNMKALLTDIFGVTLVSLDIKSGEKKTIDVVNYARGVYYLQFFDQAGKMLSSQKVVIN
jgi:hypothetical protein